MMMYKNRLVDVHMLLSGLPWSIEYRTIGVEHLFELSVYSSLVTFCS
jgi:hypothetical protein